MIYITSDPHSKLNPIYDFCKRMETTTDDVMVILGDVGFNYYLQKSDKCRKRKANKQPITWFCIKGNHEKYAGVLPSYIEKKAFGGTVYVEPEYPNILFAKDGEIYTFEVDGAPKKTLVIGGAYSVDKYHLLANDKRWFADEQPSAAVKEYVEKQVKKYGPEIDFVFSHTCPERYIPHEWFMPDVDQKIVDRSTEKWLDSIYEKLDVTRWYCGHFHGEKVIDNVEFVYHGYTSLPHISFKHSSKKTI